MLPITKIREIWDKGLSLKGFIIVILICITIPIFFELLFYYQNNQYRTWIFHFHLQDDIRFLWKTYDFIDYLYILIGLWLFAGSILGFIVTYNYDLLHYYEYPICTSMLCFYLICSMLRCRNLKVNVFWAFAPLYNPIALLFRRNKNTKILNTD